MKRREAQSIASIIGDFMQGEHVDDQRDQLRACALWPEVVGPYINRCTLNRWVKDGVMHVHLNSASLRNELQMSRGAIVRHINDIIGHEAITQIIIQ